MAMMRSRSPCGEDVAPQLKDFARVFGAIFKVVSSKVIDPPLNWLELLDTESAAIHPGCE